jgi:hypothetical protein
MQDFLADWKRWSKGERAAALILALLFAMVLPIAVVAAHGTY